MIPRPLGRTPVKEVGKFTVGPMKIVDVESGKSRPAPVGLEKKGGC